MYRCEGCGRIFDTPNSRYENVGFAEAPYWEWEESSPCCGCSFEEVEEGYEEPIYW